MQEKLRAYVGTVRGKLRPARVAPKILLTASVLTAALLVVLFFSASIYVEYYRGRVYPGVLIDNYPVGGLPAAALRDFIENVNNRYAKEGIDLAVLDARGNQHQIKLNTVIAGDSTGELLHLDSSRPAFAALAAGRRQGFFVNTFLPLYFRWFEPIKMRVPVVTNDAALADVLASTLAPFEDIPHNASLVFADKDPRAYTVVPEKTGKMFNYLAVISQIKQALANLSFVPIMIAPQAFTPLVTAPDVERIAPKLPIIFAYGPLALTYVDTQTKLRRDWIIPPARALGWLEVRKDSDNNFIFALAPAAVREYLESEVRPAVDVAAQEAKFVMADNKVKEFQASRSGVALDAEKTYADLDAAFRERNYAPQTPVLTINVAANISEPQIKTADVNNLGITDIIGVGFSTFKDSHTNRIKNIARAVARLNGVLIKPGEEFSALKYAGPFTSENGFLPEMVIKGREIKPEIGGGMCQIGTTLFRMAMNSGMDITARRNHSLVVGYYADPVNGNPGTDATLYEPMLDLKFKNDTGNHLLLQTEVDYKRQQLTFTLWGRPDGRQGWYTHPLVAKWIPAGAPQTIEVTDGSLKPGQEKCQNAFRGAVASFIYSRLTPGGEKIDRLFDSYYRPLPKICMVGVSAASSTPTGGPVEFGEPAQ